MIKFKLEATVTDLDDDEESYSVEDFKSDFEQWLAETNLQSDEVTITKVEE